MRADAIIALIFRQHFIDRDCDEFSGFVTKPESHRRDLSICVGTGNHLHRDINAQYAFHLLRSFPCDSAYSISPTHLFKQVNFTTFKPYETHRRIGDWIHESRVLLRGGYYMNRERETCRLHLIDLG